MENYYKILQISENASQDEIKKQYKALAKKYHPDIAKNKSEAENMMKKLNIAYDVIGNAEARAEYDAKLAARRRPPETQTRTTSSTNNYSSNSSGMYYTSSNPFGRANNRSTYTYQTNQAHQNNTTQETYDYSNSNRTYYESIFDNIFHTKKMERARSILDYFFSKYFWQTMAVIFVVLIVMLNIEIDNLKNGKTDWVEYNKPPKETTETANPIIQDDVPREMVEELLKNVKNFNGGNIRKLLENPGAINKEDEKIILANNKYYKLLTNNMKFTYAGEYIYPTQALVTYKVTNINTSKLFETYYYDTLLNDIDKEEAFLNAYDNIRNETISREITFVLDKMPENGEWKINLTDNMVIWIIGTNFNRLAKAFSIF